MHTVIIIVLLFWVFGAFGKKPIDVNQDASLFWIVVLLLLVAL